MKKIIIALVAILIVGAAGWYFLSPLFIDEVVDEPFPLTATTPSETSSDEMPLDAEDHQMTQAEIDALSDEEKAEMELKLIAEMEGEDTVMEETLPDISQTEGQGETEASNEPVLLSSGTFEDADDFHQGAGDAMIYELPDGSHLLRFEDFEVTNGPDLRVYLVAESNPTTDQVGSGVELAELKGNIGSQNYEIPADIDPADYQSVVIYCKPFSVIFTVATLS